MDEHSLSLTLTLTEALLVAESLRLAGEKAWAIPRDSRLLPEDTPNKSLEDRFDQAVLTLGEAIQTQAEATCDVHITEPENWTVHRWVSYVARIGQDPTGLTVQTKLTAQRREFAADTGTVVEEPPQMAKEDIVAKLKETQPWVRHVRDARGRFRRRIP